MIIVIVIVVITTNFIFIATLMTQNAAQSAYKRNTSGVKTSDINKIQMKERFKNRKNKL